MPLIFEPDDLVRAETVFVPNDDADDVEKLFDDEEELEGGKRPPADEEVEEGKMPPDDDGPDDEVGKTPPDDDEVDEGKIPPDDDEVLEGKREPDEDVVGNELLVKALLLFPT
jgi:hypothetical protein